MQLTTSPYISLAGYVYLQKVCNSEHMFPQKQNYRKVLEPLGKLTEPHLTFNVIAVELSIKSDIRPYTTIRPFIWKNSFERCQEFKALCACDKGSGEPLALDQLGVGAGISLKARLDDWVKGPGQVPLTFKGFEFASGLWEKGSDTQWGLCTSDAGRRRQHKRTILGQKHNS